MYEVMMLDMQQKRRGLKGMEILDSDSD